MPANYVLLEKITVGAAGASSVTFNSIPQSGYTDLEIRTSVRSLGDYGTGYEMIDDLLIRFNGDSGSNYVKRTLTGIGSSVLTAGGTATVVPLYADGARATANTFSNSSCYITNYTGSTYKSVSTDTVTENNATTAYMGLFASLWNNTSAITSISMITGTGANFAQYSTFYLYGVAKLGTTPVIAPKATGGDIIMSDGTYWYHSFLSSGTFTPAVGLSCDYLVVAGGGGAGFGQNSSSPGGGAGAGGLRSTVTATGGGGSLESKLNLTNTNYTVTIGAGGTGGTFTVAPTNGNDSVFSTITSTGGGRGGNNNVPGGLNGSSGGSGGGGAGGGYGSPPTGGSGTSNQGYAGANGYTSPNYGGGGGGGAGAVGTSGTTNGGNGGNGVAVAITGSSVTYAGGGGGGVYTTGGVGGTGGTGGGGTGGTGSGTGIPTAGTANTGGGGGGAGATSGSPGAGQTGGQGGSGIVIIRYPIA
jgi:hypothetical protein